MCPWRSGDRTSECGETPFLLAARDNRSVFLRVWGEELAATPGADPPPCHTANRLLVYDAHTQRSDLIHFRVTTEILAGSSR